MLGRPNTLFEHLRQLGAFDNVQEAYADFERYLMDAQLDDIRGVFYNLLTQWIEWKKGEVWLSYGLEDLAQGKHMNLLSESFGLTHLVLNDLCVEGADLGGLADYFRGLADAVDQAAAKSRTNG